MSEPRSLAGARRARAEKVAAPEAAAPGRSIGYLSQLLGFRFRRIQNHLSTGLTQMPAFDGSKPGELSALAVIQANPGLSQIELSSEVGLDKAQMVILIDELERNGWARRTRDPEDRRRNTLRITPAGEAVLERWIAVARENERSVREALTQEEFAQLSTLLDRIYNQCFNRLEG
jgi:DNA-binding MarR family transcriptional regulator